MENTSQQQQSSHDEIARLAYQIWEQRGRPQGGDMECWLEAEREIRLAAKPSQEQFAAPGRSADSPAVQTQPRQTPAKSASLARSRTSRRATTKTESDMKQGTAPTTIPSAGHTKPAARAVTRP